MDFFGLVPAIRTYCTNYATPIYFIYGEDAYVNAQADANLYAANDLILVADFTVRPTIETGRVVSLVYEGVISLGRKLESETESTIDETPIQKYDRRLSALSSLLCSIIGEIACDNELDITAINMRYDMNKFDLNADFVAATITLEQ